MSKSKREETSTQLESCKAKLKETEKKLRTVENKCAELEKTNRIIHHERINLALENKNLKLQLKNVNLYSKNILEYSIKITDHVSEIISTCSSQENTVLGVTPLQNENRTKIIRPMVGGHVIQTPVINLTRFNPEELERMAISYSSVEGLLNNTTSSTATEADTTNASANSENNIDIQANQSVPVFSGIFNDVKIYLTPLQNMPTLSPKIARELQVLREKSNNGSSISVVASTSTIDNSLPSLNATTSSIKPVEVPKKRGRKPLSQNLKKRSASLDALPSNQSTPKMSTRQTVNNNVSMQDTREQNVGKENMAEKFKAMRLLGLTPTSTFVAKLGDNSNEKQPQEENKKLQRHLKHMAIDMNPINFTVVSPRLRKTVLKDPVEKVSDKNKRSSKTVVQDLIDKNRDKKKSSEKLKKKKKNELGGKQCNKCGKLCSKVIRCCGCYKVYHTICVKRNKMPKIRNKLTKCSTCVKSTGPFMNNKVSKKKNRRN